jgi:hypothetical protein
MNEGYTIGEPDFDFAIGKTDFECWGRLWRASASDPEVPGEEWVTFVKRIQEYLKLTLIVRHPSSSSAIRKSG